jgi:membrane-bound ClpP family serine protease
MGMSQEDWACIGLIIIGIILILIGANYYNEVFGWLGVFLFLVGILAIIALYVYNSLKKEESKEQTDMISAEV